MLEVNTLSGFEGVGKSTIINHCHKNHGYYVIPETARLIIPLEKTVLRDSRDDLSYKSFISYLTNLHFMLSNNMAIEVVSDRNIIDSLTYLKLYSDTQEISLDMTAEFIKRFNAEYNRETLYNHAILLRHTSNDEFIEKHILNDPERKYGSTVEQYKADARLWEETYLTIADHLMSHGLARRLHVIKSFPDNIQVIDSVTDIIINR